MKDNSLIKRAYQIIFITFLAAAMAIMLDDVILVPINYRLFMILVVIIIILADVICIFNRNKLTYIVIAAVALLTGFMCLQPEVYGFIKNTITYAEYGCYPDEAAKSAYIILITFVMAFAAAVISYVISLFTYVRIGVPIVLIVVCIICRINSFDISHIALAAILFTFMISVSELMCVITKNDRNTAIYMTPVFLVFCIVVAVIPVSDKPLEWKQTKKIINVVETRAGDMWNDLIHFLGIEDLFGGDILSGYSEGSEMDFYDSISGNSTVQLSITGRPVKANMYVTGTWYNHFNNNGWSAEYTDLDYPETSIDFIEKVTALFDSNISPTNYNQFVNVRKINLQYENIKTKTAFSVNPLISMENVEDSEDEENYSNVDDIKERDGSRKFTEDQVEGMSYYLTHLNIDYSSPYFEYMCTHVHKDIYNEKLDVIQRKMLYAYKHSFSNDEKLISKYEKYMKNRQEYIKDNYMALPDSISDRVYSLAESLTKDEKGDYYKAKAIQNYLKTNYSYNKKPKKADENHYIESFLFDTKEGFCMHFATAMAIMARCVDIPSRIVTGYCVNYDGSPGKSVIHYVQGSAAHTWAEVYIEGIGWVRCEATPHYADNAEIAWRTRGENEYNYIMKNGKPSPIDIIAKETLINKVYIQHYPVLSSF